MAFLVLPQQFLLIASAIGAIFCIVDGKFADGAVFDVEGWKVDAAVIAVLSQHLNEADRAAAEKIVRALYLPWAEESALNFQRVAKQEVSAFRVSPLPKPPLASYYCLSMRSGSIWGKCFWKDCVVSASIARSAANGAPSLQ